MAYLTVNFTQRPSDEDIRDLKTELKSLTEVQEQGTESFDLASFALVVGLGANAIKVVETLNNWLKRARGGNEAVIQLSDGRKFELKANTDPEVFLKQLKAALKDL